MLSPRRARDGLGASAPSMPRLSGTHAGAAVPSSPSLQPRSASSSPVPSPTSSPRQEAGGAPLTPRTAAVPASPRVSPRSRISTFLKNLVKKGDEGEEEPAASAAEEEGKGAVDAAKPRVKSAYSTPLMKRRKSPRGSSQPPQDSSGDVYIFKKDEPSAFPGFMVSTMAGREKQQRRTAADVFEDQSQNASQVEEEDPPLPQLPPERPLGIAELPELPTLSEEETLKMLAPVAGDRMRVAKRTKRLDLAGFVLGFVPSALRELKTLTTLNLAGNNVRNFGDNSPLSGLTGLQELDLSFNDLSHALASQEVGSEMAHLQLPASITNLSLRDNALNDVPAGWLLDQLPQLSGLDIRFNNVAALDGLWRCKELAELLACHNDLTAVPAGVFRGCSEALKSVDLSNNQIRSIDAAAVEEIPRIEALVLSHNRLSAFNFTAALHNLTSLDLSHNGLTELAGEFGLLTRLRTLRARSNKIASLQFSFGALEELRLLDLSHNNLSTLPDDLALARNLRTVMVACNELSDLSVVAWEVLDTLSVLVCSGNQLESLPDLLSSHPSLEVLYAGYNRIGHAESFQGSARLKILHLGGNVGMTIGQELVSLHSNPRLFQLILGGAELSEAQLSFVEDYGDSLMVDPGTQGAETAFQRSTGLAETVGLRSAMEDRSVAAAVRVQGKERRMWAVFDGHGGDAGSVWCAAEVGKLLERHLSSAGSFQDIFGRVFAALNEGVSRVSTGGSTAVVAVEINGKLHVANAGDARAVLLRRGKAQRLSVDHRTTLESERERIRRGGGVVLNGRLGGVIEVTRALGDAAVPLCIAEPHVASVAVEEGDVLVLGCDGIFDELSDDMVASIVARAGEDRLLAAQMLRDEAFYLGSSDNLSCIVATIK